MIGLFVKYILIFIGFILLQVLVLNNITLFNGWAQPYLYIYPLIALPLMVPKRFILIIGFVVGLTIDMFTHTPGIHASATLALAFMRPSVLKAIRPREGFKSYIPSMKTMGVTKYFTYSGLLVLIHNLWLFALLYFSTGLILTAIGHALLSTIFTLILILILQLFTQPKKSF
jgi:rod shape-determining protein MreD